MCKSIILVNEGKIHFLSKGLILFTLLGILINDLIRSNYLEVSIN